MMRREGRFPNKTEEAQLGAYRVSSANEVVETDVGVCGILGMFFVLLGWSHYDGEQYG